MEFTEQDKLLVTGATGLVGSHVVERARKENIPTRVIVRENSDQDLLKEWGVEIVHGDLTDKESLRQAVEGVTAIVHCAARVGDWGPVENYREVNVRGTEALLNAAEATGALKRFVQISSLGVYRARDHHGTDENEPPNTDGIDGYTLTKVESEQLILQHVKEKNLPAIVLRPGFIYGPRDRIVLPRLMEKLKTNSFAFLGDGTKLMNNTFVGNLVDAIFLALNRDDLTGEVFNIRDARLVSKREFMETIAEAAGFDKPEKQVPLGVAKFLARVMEGTAKLLGKKEAPLLSNARVKFLGLNLDYSIDKAKQELGYEPKVDYAEGMTNTIHWFRDQGLT